MLKNPAPSSFPHTHHSLSPLFPHYFHLLLDKSPPINYTFPQEDTMILTQAILAGLAALATAHPGHEDAEHAHAVRHREATHSHKRALENCAAKLQTRGVTSRSVERRSATLAKHRAQRGISLDGTFVDPGPNHI